jgi:regulator of RNase E activity RraA
MIGFRILQRRRAVSADIIEAFRALPVANVSDSMFRMAAGGASLRPMHDTQAAGSKPLAGPAVTVKVRPGDNLMLHKALDLALPGDVVVCDAGGDLTNALFGELMVAHAIKRGLGGVVIHGAIRDSATIRAGTFPIFAAGVTHRGPYKDGPGEINVAIAIDGMVIEPGDLMLGDDDGLVCVPFDQTSAVLAATQNKQAAEVKQLASIAAGTSDRSWIDATLTRLGCKRED